MNKAEGDGREATDVIGAKPIVANDDNYGDDDVEYTFEELYGVAA